MRLAKINSLSAVLILVLFFAASCVPPRHRPPRPPKPPRPHAVVEVSALQGALAAR